MEERFDKTFPKEYFINSQAGLFSERHGYKQTKELKSFIQSEIDLAVAERNKKTLEKIKQYLLEEHIHFEEGEPLDNWQFEDGKPYVNSLELEKFITKLITTK